MIRKKLVVVVLCAIGLFGCSNQWLDDYRLDPNRPSEVSMQVLLPAIQANYAMVQGDVLARASAEWMQHMTSQIRTAYEYNYDRTWNNAYAGGLYDLKLLREQALALDAPAYAGIADIMTALYMGLLVDHFGDVPFTQALSGSQNLKPGYDSGAVVYDSIFSLLSRGKEQLLRSSAMVPGGDDLMLQGDLGAWAAVADGLVARNLNHLSELPAYDAAAVIAACDSALGVGVDFQIGFEEEINQNPWYQFTVIDRVGYFTQEGFLHSRMDSTADPRVAFYRSSDLWSIPSLGAATADLPVLTTFELEFIKAEAQFRSGDLAGARGSMEQGIAANMSYLGVASDSAQLYIDSLPGATTLELIMEEKYISMFTQGESWTDWRRTGYPALSADPLWYLTEIPRRMPYPESEYLYNNQQVPMPEDATFEERYGISGEYRIFWDK